MYAVGRLGSYISRGVYTVSGPFHPFGGAVDIIVVQQPDGSFKSSPWYVRFGKFQGVLKTKEKVVSINVNGVDASFHMYLDHKGEAYFLSEVEEGEDGQATLSPSSSSSDDTDGQSNRRPLKSKSCNYDASRSDIAGRAGSRRQRILGLVFGRRSLKEDSLGAKGEDGPGVGRVDSLERAEIAADLLDLNWSTSLATKKQRKDSRSRFLTRNAFDNEAKEVSNDKIGQESDNDLSMESSPGDASIHLPSLCTEGVVEIPSLDEGVEKACALTPEKFESYKNNLDWDEKEVVVATAYKEMDELCVEEITVDLPEYSFSEESQLKRVQSSGNCETSESSHRDLQLHASCDQYIDKLYLANGGEEARETHLETITVKTEMLSKILHQDTSTGQQCGNNELHTKQEDVPEVTLLHSMVCEQSELLLEEPLREVSSEQNVHTEETSPGLYSIPASGDKHYEANEEERIRDDANGPFNLETSCDTKSFVGDCDLSKPTSAPSSEISDNVQFLFSDLDDSKLNELMHQEGKLNGLMNEEVNDCFRHGATALSDADERSDASLGNLGEEITLANAEDTNKEIKSSPIIITRNYTLDNEEVERLVESMPPMQSEIDNLDSYLVQVPLSQSLDTTSKSLEFPKDDACSTKSDGCAEQHLTSGQIDVGDADGLVPAENIHVSPSVEISLCRHMLYEGMGADAAAKAFDAEKLDINRFESLGPTVVKNDRLVVRIKGRYFPWDAAARIILGMVSFGSKLIPEPKGMIAVDKVERDLEADSSKEVGPTPGNWRIWPFSFKKSRSGKIIHDARAFSDEKTLESTTSENADKGPLKPRVMKKMVRVLTPTSDQLASLNLKEGSNSVTFTFSTAMLGNQRVDARIYLWKWNTRIIISDVDGTITKSDVLGQFMPLVGMDWSQTGVAHLFSAIKENGYQMLFLSARAISQAYHTRQFLFNLKQDGKCLPDGPVVISPDGLFPSLYREVIRRAPHEFKIACLEDIKALFPPGCNPFYAGFGNRDTDEISYLKVGIPKGKIFTINPKGEVAVNRHINTKSYSSLHALVHGMFPSLSASTSTTHEQIITAGIIGSCRLLISIFDAIRAKTSCSRIQRQLGGHANQETPRAAVKKADRRVAFLSHVEKIDEIDETA